MSKPTRSIAKLLSIIIALSTAFWLLSCSEASYKLWPKPVTVMWERTYNVSPDHYNLANSILASPNDCSIIAGAGGADIYPSFVLGFNSIGDSLWSLILNQEYGEVQDIARADDGSCIILATKDSIFWSGEHIDIHLIKYNCDGDELWAKRVGINGHYSGLSITALTDDSYVIAGMSQDQHGPRDLHLVRVNSLGDIIWTRIIDDAGNRNGGLSVIQTQDGNIVVAGLTYLHIFPRLDKLWLAKISLNGDLMWSKRIGLGEDQISSCKVIEGFDGSLLFSVNQYRNDIDGTQYQWASLGRTNSSGNLIWLKKYNQTDRQVFASITEISQSRVMAVGYRDPINDYPNVIFEPYLLVIDLNGVTIREMSIDIGDSASTVLWSADLDTDGNVLAAGSTGYDVYLVKIDGSSLH